MKSTVFVRPDLKLFLLGALLIVVVHNLILSGHSEVTVLTASGHHSNASALLHSQLHDLLAEAREKPSHELFMRISAAFEKLGNYREAVRYLRRAEKLRSAQEAED